MSITKFPAGVLTGDKVGQCFAESIGWEMVAPAADLFGAPTPEKLAASDCIAGGMAAKLLGK